MLKSGIKISENRSFADSLLEAIPLPVFYKDKNGFYLGINKAFERFFGTTRQEMIGKSVFDIHPPELARVYYKKDRELLINGGTQQYQFRIRNHCGEMRDVIFDKAVFTGPAGSILGLVGIIRDITESNRVSKALRESESRYRLLFEGNRDGIVSVDSKGRFLNANQAYCNMLGYRLEELKAMDDFYEITPEQWRGWEQEEIWNKRLLQQGFTGVYEKEYLRKDGSVFPVELQSFAVLDENGRPDYLWGVARDITERKQLENRLQQSSKMESIGVLAGGMAHEFNNILGGMMAYTEIAREDIRQSSPAQKSLAEIYRLSCRAQDIIKQILTFSRNDQLEKKKVNIEQLIEETLQFLNATLPKNIEIRYRHKKQSGTVSADRSQLHQVILNLCINAAQAMEKNGGVLELGLSPVKLNAAEAKSFPDLSAGQYLQLTVRDSGIGIEKTLVDKIFDPFFTTKETGKGTGMGLAVVHGIVKAHDGAITVSSRPGRGTTFTVLLPRAGTAASEKSAPTDHRELPTGRENILLVDDEEFIVLPVKRSLERLGYRVTAVTCSRKALTVFKKDPRHYDLLITDQNMPNLTGARLAAAVAAIRPDIPVILISGYADAAETGKLSADSIRAFMTKPFKKPDLAQTVRRVLDEKKDNGSEKSGHSQKDIASGIGCGEDKLPKTGQDVSVNDGYE